MPGIEIIRTLFDDLTTILGQPLEIWGYEFTWLEICFFTFGVDIAGMIIWSIIGNDD